MTSVSLVAVGDDTLEAVQHDGSVWVSLRRVCEALGLNPDGQRVKLQGYHWARTEMISVRDTAGRTQRACFVHARTLPMWLANIDESRVDARAAFTLRRFQVEAADALANAFPDIVGAREGLSPSRPSGGTIGSGGAPAQRPVTSMVPAGDIDPLAVVDALAALAGAIRSGRTELAEVRAEVRAEVAVERDARVQLQLEVQAANARADDAMTIADRAVRNSTMARESARAIKATAAYITKQIRAHCATSGLSYQAVFSRCRRDLMLPPSKDSKRTLSDSIKRADQALSYARSAASQGVPRCTPAIINALLDGDDGDPDRAGFIDVATKAIQ